MVTKEKDIERQILDFLVSCSIFVFKVNTVGVWDPVKSIYRLPKSQHIIRGIADIIGIYQGKFLAIEVKTPKRKKLLSEEQKLFLDTVKSQGGIALVATCVEDVIEALGLKGESPIWSVLKELRKS